MAVLEKNISFFTSPFEIINISKKGLPKKAVDILTKKINLSDRQMARILNINERTFHRYKDDTILDLISTEKLLQLGQLYFKGEQVFESLENFKVWMLKPHIIFFERSPIELLDTNTGFKLVEEELGKIEFGIYL